MKKETSAILHEQLTIENVSPTILHETSSIPGGSFTIPKVRSDILDRSRCIENVSLTIENVSLTIHGCIFRTSEEKGGFSSSCSMRATSRRRCDQQPELPGAHADGRRGRSVNAAKEPTPPRAPEGIGLESARDYRLPPAGMGAMGQSISSGTLAFGPACSMTRAHSSTGMRRGPNGDASAASESMSSVGVSTW
jgi:hypothetical protein